MGIWDTVKNLGSAIVPGVAPVAEMAEGFWNSVSGQQNPNNVPNLQAEPRADQRAGEKTLGTWAMTGEGPSAAQELISRNRAENAAQQVGMAKSMGGDPALANRNAAEGIARGSSEAAFQGSIMRSQEQQQAMQNYMDSLHATRAQDLGYQGALWNIDAQNAANEQGLWLSLLNTGAKAAGGM